jgi:hypothetical protein
MRDTIEMAREAGIKFSPAQFAGVLEAELDEFSLKAFEDIVRADEREQAEERVTDLFADMETPYLPDIIKVIRARGEASKRGETK